MFQISRHPLMRQMYSLDHHEGSCILLQRMLEITAHEAPSPSDYPRTSTPKKRKQKPTTVSKLRVKLKKNMKSLENKDRVIERLRKQIKRMEMRREERGKYNLPTKEVCSSMNRRQLMGSVVRIFFHLHKRFLTENPTKRISRAQFFKLRPFWISSPTLLDREICACKIHENFQSKRSCTNLGFQAPLLLLRGC